MAPVIRELRVRPDEFERKRHNRFAGGIGGKCLKMTVYLWLTFADRGFSFTCQHVWRNLTMPYSAKAIANYFLDRANAAGQEITPMKMQKLVYIAHGWHLAVHGEPLVDETVEAWRFGPVIPSLFQAFKKYGASPITDYADGARLPNDANVRDVLNQVMGVYGNRDAIHLMRLTHAKGSPWRSVRDEGDISSYGDEVINDDVIKNHFAQLIAAAQENKKRAA